LGVTDAPQSSNGVGFSWLVKTDGAGNSQWQKRRDAARQGGRTRVRFRVVDLAPDASDGAGMFKGNELERLYRDARCGRFHPANSMVAHKVVGKSVLGVVFDPGPRWG
jgi:alkylation response protein AidB-like acyl-CoA dehydrogenase